MGLRRIAGFLLGTSLSVSVLGPAEAAGDQAGKRLAAIVVPIDFEAGQKRLDEMVPSPEMTQQAKEKLEHSLDLAFARIKAFDRVALPELSPEEARAFAEHLGYIKVHVFARTEYHRSAQNFNRPLRDRSPPHSVGPRLAFLADRSGADFLVFMFGRKFSASSDKVTPVVWDFGHRLSLVTTTAPSLSVSMPNPKPLVLKNTQLGIAVVELRTGNIRWMNFLEDLNADVTDRRGANAYMLPVFGDYPKSAIGDFGAFEDLPLADDWEDHTANFKARMPQGWQRVTLPAQLALTRHGLMIDTMFVERVKPAEATKMLGLETELTRANPLELGRLSAERMKMDPGYGTMRSGRIEPVTVGGRPGFVFDSDYLRKYPLVATVPYRMRTYGVANEEGLYLLSLEAPSTVYFDRDLPAFESLVASLTLGKVTSESFSERNAKKNRKR